MRTIWVQGSAAETMESADEAIARIVSGGFDTFQFLVGSGMVNYNSIYLNRYSDYDRLAYMVQQGHAAGLNVHAWWCPGCAPQSADFRTLYPDYDIYLLPEITVHWLDFSQADARQLVANVVEEIGTDYDVDGVHLDYIRYSYDCGPKACYYYPEYFSKEDVSQAVDLSYDQLKAVDPGLLLTCAVMTYGGKWHLQAWSEWLDGGYVDHVMPMAYYAPDENEDLQTDIDYWDGLDDYHDEIVPGLIVYVGSGPDKVPKTWEELSTQIQMCRNSGFYGYSMFDEKNITDEILALLNEESSSYMPGFPDVTGALPWSFSFTVPSFYSG